MLVRKWRSAARRSNSEVRYDDRRAGKVGSGRLLILILDSRRFVAQETPNFMLFLTIA